MVVPRTVDAAVEAIAVCRDFDVPVLSRGGGTSLAGQCVNEAVVIDWTKYCHGLVSVNPEARTAVLQPGLALDKANDALASYGLMVGPRPSTHVSCTIGGMIGNNSCGASAQAYGKMVDAVRRLEVLTYGGLRMWTGETSDAEYEQIIAAGGEKAELYRGLRQIRDTHLSRSAPATRRSRAGSPATTWTRCCPSAGSTSRGPWSAARARWSPCCTRRSISGRCPGTSRWSCSATPTSPRRRDVVPLVVRHSPLLLEGLDDVLISLEREEHLSAGALKQLPEGSGWLMIQFGGDTQDEADDRAQALLDDVNSEGSHPRPHVAYTEDPAVEDRLQDVREAGLGATAYPPGKHETHEGWEDAAVPPDRLGDYLRDFRKLLERYDYRGASLYGHFGQGCVHTRIPFELRTEDGIAAYRSFVQDAADLVVSYGGSLSGEHGDGQSRGELLERMFGPELIRAFGELKAIFDPGNRMNPGKVVHPYRLDENLTRRGWFPREPVPFFRYPEDGGSSPRPRSRCVGIGKCRGDEGGVMCPSYRVTREEEHATRGRARLLMEMVRGEVITDGWHSDEVHDALDLCLACKGCRKECPVDVDMATYKAEFLAHHYAGRLRPAAHYSMGWLPAPSLLASAAPGVVNAVARAPGLGRLIKRAGGIDEHRELPRFAAAAVHQLVPAPGPREGGEPVLLWPDTFTNNFHPEVGQAAVSVLEDAGFRVELPAKTLCCGLTWISTGQLGVARRVLNRTIAALRPALQAGWPVVVLEPSCAAVFRSDAAELTGSDDARLLARQTRTLAELLTEAGWRPGAEDPAGLHPGARRAIAQVHCHQHAILGFDRDQELLRDCGVDVDVLDSGCCGLAGNFGFERGHYDVSVACAERGLWPAVRDADPGTAILADGFSCRTQIEAGHLGREGMHLAELLAGMLDGVPQRAHNGSSRGNGG